MSLPDLEVIDKIKGFLQKAGLDSKLQGICILTLALDRSSLVGCFVFDYNSKTLLKHYPGYYNSDCPMYKTIGERRFTINFDYNLTPMPENGKHTGLLEDFTSYPFCCKQCVTKNRLTNEHEFNNLKNSSGTSEYIFKVVRKIQRGPLEFIKFFTLINSKIEEIPSLEFEHSINSFKIYTCSRHNTYYSVNLCTRDPQYTYHHSKGRNETLYGPKILELM
jgi:hypothetical protein